jgi:hypothetical protein
MKDDAEKGESNKFGERRRGQDVALILVSIAHYSRGVSKKSRDSRSESEDLNRNGRPCLCLTSSEPLGKTQSRVH